jgi:hypothetical protein
MSKRKEYVLIGVGLAVILGAIYFTAWMPFWRG